MIFVGVSAFVGGFIIGGLVAIKLVVREMFRLGLGRAWLDARRKVVK
jgi:hypothetical protein